MFERWWYAHEAEFAVWAVFLALLVVVGLFALPFVIADRRRRTKALDAALRREPSELRARLGLSRPARPPNPLTEIIHHPPRYGGYPRETISHHEGCTVRGAGRNCGCDPIVTSDTYYPRSSS